MDAYITNLNDELLKVQPINDWRYTDSFSGQQFQQFSSGKYGDKNFNYILCQMTNNKGRWCSAK
jgi:hypothetical protein